MDIREFSNKLAEATKNMSPEEKASLMKMFESVSQEIGKEDTKKETAKDLCEYPSEGTQIPDGMTRRLKLLKENYLKQKPSIRPTVQERSQRLLLKIPVCQRSN